jgi:hypothetical protein
VAMEAPDPLHTPGFMQYGFAHYTPDDLQRMLQQAGFPYTTIVLGDQLGAPLVSSGLRDYNAPER